MTHDFSVVTDLYRLCSRCAKPDLASNKRKPCLELPPDEVMAAIVRKAAQASRFRGYPSATKRPVVNKQPARRGVRS